MRRRIALLRSALGSLTLGRKRNLISPAQVWYPCFENEFHSRRTNHNRFETRCPSDQAPSRTRFPRSGSASTDRAQIDAQRAAIDLEPDAAGTPDSQAGLKMRDRVA
jgi:hypothetical protein